MCCIPVSDEISWWSLWSRSMMLWSLNAKNTTLISRWIIFNLLRPIWSRYLNVTDTFCQFCGICGITDLESHLEVTRRRWFQYQSKARIRLPKKFLLDLNSNLGPILSRFRDIRAFVCRKPLFRYPSAIQPKFQSVPLAEGPGYWGQVCREQRRTIPRSA